MAPTPLRSLWSSPRSTCRSWRASGREIIEAETTGKAVIPARATEPAGGSYVEDLDDIALAPSALRFKRVPGGFRLDARKVFISNGSIARYHVLTAFEDMKRPLETMRAFLVPEDAAGLSIGRIERKIGQRLSPAVEVLCDDVFVPSSHVIGLDDGGRAIDTTLSLTRGPVGAMATGIIRGTLERTLRTWSRSACGGGGSSRSNGSSSPSPTCWPPCRRREGSTWTLVSPRTHGASRG